MQKITDTINDIGVAAIDSLIIHHPAAGAEFRKITGRKIVIKNNEMLQFEKYSGDKALHENVPLRDVPEKVAALSRGQFSQLVLRTGDAEYACILSGDDCLSMSRTNTGMDHEGGGKKTEHNRKKEYRLKENNIVDPLIDLGIFTKDGKIVNAKYHKYKQINRFLEILDDVLKQFPQKTINILDFGCGKSYLTFIVYYYLEKICNQQVNIIGLDLKEDVIQRCSETAKKYGYSHLSFQAGTIDAFVPPWQIDLVLSLHACDTATDFVLYNGIKHGAAAILSVPCCQHELNGQIRSDDYSLLTKYGIMQERISALFTDSIRANLLEAMGYKTQVLEFVDIDNTPKNVLIRAVKAAVSPKTREKALEEVAALVNQFHLSPALLRLLKENGFVK
jgi:SAM-dependent methyltransferase